MKVAVQTFGRERMSDGLRSLDGIDSPTQLFTYYVAAGLVILYFLREYVAALFILGVVGFFAYNNPEGAINAIQVFTVLFVVALLVMGVLAGIGYASLNIMGKTDVIE